MRRNAVRHPSATRLALELRFWPAVRDASPHIPHSGPVCAVTVGCTASHPARGPSCWMVDVIVESVAGGPPAGHVQTLVRADQDHSPIDVVLDRTHAELLTGAYRAVIAIRRVDTHGRVGAVAGWTDLGPLRFRPAALPETARKARKMEFPTINSIDPHSILDKVAAPSPAVVDVSQTSPISDPQ